MSDMDLSYLSDFLSTLFNIPHEDYPVVVQEDDPAVEELGKGIKAEDTTIAEKVFGETMEDIELEMEVIMQEMSATKALVKDRGKVLVDIKERVEEASSQVECDLYQVPPPVLMTDLLTPFPTPRRRGECEGRVTQRCGVEVRRLNYEHLDTIYKEKGAILVNKETNRDVNDSCSDSDGGECLDSEKCDQGNWRRRVIKKCDVRIRRMDSEQLQRVALENGAVKAFEESSSEQISSILGTTTKEFIASKEEEGEIDYNECLGDESITVVEGVITITSVEETSSDVEGHRDNQVLIGKCKIRECIEDKDHQVTTTSTGEETSLGPLVDVLPVQDSSATVFPVHRSSSTVLPVHDSFEAVTPSYDSSTAVVAVRATPSSVTPSNGSFSAVTPVNVASSDATPVKGSPSCHSVASPVSAVAANVCRQLARQIREEFITREEEMVVMDVDKDGVDETITVSDDEDFADFLKFCSREESVHVERHEAVAGKPNEEVMKKKSVKKTSALKNSFKSAVKSVVNKLSVFKNKSKDENTKSKYGGKPAEKDRRLKLGDIDNNAKKTSKESRSVTEGKRQRDRDDHQAASLPNKKLKTTNNSSNSYSDSLLLNFFNPVQHLRESAPLFKIPKLVTPQSKQSEADDDKKDRVSGVQNDDASILQRPMPEGGLAKTMDVRDQMVKLDGKAISLRSFLSKEGIVPGASVQQLLTKDLKMDKSAQIPVGNIIEIDLPIRGQEAIYEVHDSEEMKDIYHKDWEIMRSVSTDEERKRISCEAFKNPVPANPGRNLTFHGYRSREKYYRPDGLYRVFNRPTLPVGSFAIKSGVLEPLPGYKRRRNECQPSQGEDKGGKIVYADLGNCMKSLFYQKYENKMKGRKVSQHQFEQFQDYLAHYKAGQEETENFLAFYSNKKAIEVDELQVDEVWDTEAVLSRYKMYYGNPDPVFCDICAKRHLFSQ